MEDKDKLIDGSSIAARSTQLAPEVYMTMVGIVQSLALVYFFTAAALARYIGGSCLPSMAIPFVSQHLEVTALRSGADFYLATMQALVDFLLIVLTWHVNIQNMVAFKRVFGLLDSLIPFSFAVPEYYFITYSRPDAFSLWAFSLTIFMLCAVLAYSHLFGRAEKECFETWNKKILHWIGDYPFGYAAISAWLDW